MYICLECGCLFEEPKCYYEKHGLDCPPYEEWLGSPCCRGDYVEAYRCDYCGEYINTDTYVEVGNKKYCEECFTIKNLEDL
jgi:hypothetical protein